MESKVDIKSSDKQCLVVEQVLGREPRPALWVELSLGWAVWLCTGKLCSFSGPHFPPHGSRGAAWLGSEGHRSVTSWNTWGGDAVSLLEHTGDSERLVPAAFWDGFSFLERTHMSWLGKMTMTKICVSFFKWKENECTYLESTDSKARLSTSLYPGQSLWSSLNT